MIADAPAIETQVLLKRFGEVVAVDRIDLRVPAHGVYGFLGPNGAGKTTTIRMLVGLVRPTAGEARLLGETVGPGAEVLGRVGALVERPAFYPYLSAADNLALVAITRGLVQPALSARVAEVLDRAGLADVARRKVGRFSTGMRQRLGIAAALLHRPQLVILDEPTSGLDPEGVVDVRRLIAELAADGVSIFLSSHVLPEVEQTCDRVAILRAGRIVAEGETADMLRRGARLAIRFDSVHEAEDALPVLATMAIGPIEHEPGTTLALIDAAPGLGSAVSRALAAAGLFPAELAVRRPSLETVFMELVGEHATGGDGAPPSASAVGLA
jgi:ABC-2 type transport system ATP-binding protein